MKLTQHQSSAGCLLDDGGGATGLSCQTALAGYQADPGLC